MNSEKKNYSLNCELCIFLNRLNWFNAHCPKSNPYPLYVFVNLLGAYNIKSIKNKTQSKNSCDVSTIFCSASIFSSIQEHFENNSDIGAKTLKITNMIKKSTQCLEN